MNFYTRLISNHPLTNVLFAIVIITGIYSYLSLPRQQDPDVNFNWVEIQVILPGATTGDMEEQVTDVIEEALSNLQDVRFIFSTATDGRSTTLVRFNQLDENTFNKRLADLRREIQNAEQDLPEQALSPNVTEITTSSGFPTMALLIKRASLNEDLYYHANLIGKEIKRIKGVESIWSVGYAEPEIHINLDRSALENYGISPNQVISSLRASLVNLSAGSVDISGEKWQFSLNNSLADTSVIAQVPIMDRADVYVGNIAEVVIAREKNSTLASADGEPAIQINLFKSPGTSVIDMTNRIVEYVDKKNATLSNSGIYLSVLDDQSPTTRKALSIMENNSIIGLLLVLFSTWLFLGSRIAIFCTMGIPFVMCLVFVALKQLGQTLNLSVLLGLVMSVGIIVDNMIVVAESIRFNIRKGEELTSATVNGLLEVIKPLTSGVLTTIAAFAPLMFVEGILGQFMLVIPLVVTTALLMSMIQAYWILPSHVMNRAAQQETTSHSAVEMRRRRCIEWIQNNYLRFLIGIIRKPKKTIIYCTAGLIVASILTVGGIAFPKIHQTFFGNFFLRVEFFAFDPLRIVYFDVNMPNATTVETTLESAKKMERHIRSLVPEDEVRGISSYAGLQFIDQGVATGPDRGQVLVSLLPSHSDSEPIDQIRDRILKDITPEDFGAKEIGSFIVEGGPPKTKPIQLNVLGDDFPTIRMAVADIKTILEGIEGVHSIEVDENFGQRQIIAKYNHDAISNDGISYREIDDLLAVISNGLIITEIQNLGETTDIRVNADQYLASGINDVLDYRIRTQDGSSVPLSRYVQFEAVRGQSAISHFDFRRSIRVEADSDTYNQQDAQKIIAKAWDGDYAANYPSISINSSGILDDLNEAIASLVYLFALGVLIIYLLLCNEFRSYFKPFLILTTLPMSFVGVIIGLLLSNQPMSLFTMYGVVALTGISVNASIVLIDAIERRREQGMPLSHAVLFASRRRIIPIIITSLTTIAGLFSLAAGIGGKSLAWGPVAVAIVWGVGFSSTMTLIIIPYLYMIFHRKKKGESEPEAIEPTAQIAASSAFAINPEKDARPADSG